ncbi:virion protein [Ferrimonas balearica]|uniref:virion protein n=1 Tax=Ferrimonas balearica TaxID=44012 RepID=UPI001C99249B|nr:virion protein [Ferrimonas balearica]MBY5920421.1 virion protein [Ferrimonas balearica]MBY5996894.1 virion protein [Ferrimonas balearica]
MSKQRQPRGIRNHNPGNIRHNPANPWLGMKGVDTGGFVRFGTPFYGLRAMAKVLLSYRQRGLYSLSQVISTWAPATENDTSAYIDHAVASLGTPPDMPLQLSQYPALMALIVQHENGQQPYPMTNIEQAWAAANA